MVKKLFSLVILIAFVFLVNGCNTVVGSLQGAKEGAKEDWKELNKADGWIRENLW